MSKKEMTIGEEFENFMSFAMRYNYKKKDIRKKKKEKNLLTPSEVRDIFRQNSWSVEMLYKRLVGIGETPDNAQILVQRILHPTEKDLELEQSVKEKDLYLD